VFKAPARLYKASELKKTSAAKTILELLHGLELQLPRLDTLSQRYRESIIYASPVIVRELPKPAHAENEKREFTPAQLVAGFVTYKLMLQTNESYNVVAMSDREANDDFLCALAWSDLFRSLIYFKTDALALLFKRLQSSCPAEVQHALFAGKLTQERFLQHLSISKHTLQERLKLLNKNTTKPSALNTSDQDSQQSLVPEMPTLAELLAGDE